VRSYAVSQVVLGGLLCAVGLAVLVRTLAAGGGALALGVVVGAGFALLGAARIWIALRGASPGGES
jgi:hypothetical protein